VWLVLLAVVDEECVVDVLVLVLIECELDGCELDGCELDSCVDQDEGEEVGVVVGTCQVLDELQPVPCVDQDEEVCEVAFS